jgi:hypothetical protein
MIWIMLHGVYTASVVGFPSILTGFGASRKRIR